MDNAWLTRGIKISASFEKSKNIGLHEHRRSPYIKNLVYHVSRTALDLISLEIKSLIRKTHGLPCACEISKRYRMGQTLQLDCIDEHWKKFSMVPVHKKVVGDVDWEPIFEKIKRRFGGSTQEQRQQILDDVLELADPKTTLLQEPKEPFATRGRPCETGSNIILIIVT
ncbi:hypothetical protein MKW94_000613 [Papaver nudicaule]|uniref:Uncharacterized protein n=1 Tax=Papaver nudicaule TaxID=74823 RepID=A0AA41VC25_PAPNU|nr:hypothetical protein [Papaver nudicaule]